MWFSCLRNTIITTLKTNKQTKKTTDETQVGSYFIFWRIGVHGLVCKTEAVKCQRTPVTGEGALRYIGVHICGGGKHVWKGVLFAVERIKQGMHLRVWNAIFQEKGGGFVKSYSNSSGSNLYRGSNLRQNPLFRDDFCIMTKMCLRAYFKTLVYTLYACISEQSPPDSVSLLNSLSGTCLLQTFTAINLK